MLPFYLALQAGRVASEAWLTGLRSAETLVAAGSVIRARSGLIETALRRPDRADHRELTKMVMEKPPAFAEAGRILGDAFLAWQKAIAASPSSALGAVDAWAELMAAQRLALAPVRNAATANSRRLRRPRRRR